MKKDLIYIAIPKSAGVSVQNSGLIKPENWQGHKRAVDVPNLNDFFSFTFIRNPYEKVLSSYFYWFGKTAERFKKWKEQYPTFTDFILDYDNSTKLEKNHFTHTNWEYITDNDGNILVDFIGYFDFLERDFFMVQKMNGINNNEIISLPKMNESNHIFWKTYYTKELAEVVYNKWEMDFKNFRFNEDSYINL